MVTMILLSVILTYLLPALKPGQMILTNFSKHKMLSAFIFCHSTLIQRLWLQRQLKEFFFQVAKLWFEPWYS